MKAIRLRVNDMTAPLGMGDAAPRFSWNCEGGKKQTAYRLTCSREGEVIFDSGKVASPSMRNIPYEGEALLSRDIVTWQVTLWDENDQPGQVSESRFELGLIGSRADWGDAKWITGDYRPVKSRRYPADCFKKEFAAGKPVARARLYAAARGVYDAAVNGQRIEDFILAPGSTDYRKRIQVQTYDVTGLLKEENVLELRLADGWFRGSIAAYGVTNVYGEQTSLIARLEILYEDGSREDIVTDRGWAWSNDGPIRFADLKDGEIVEAAMQPSYSGMAREVAPPKAALLPSDNVPVTEHERLSPVLLGENVLDFGQNIAGYLEFTVTGRPGQKLRVVCGEMLDAQGNVSLANIAIDRPAQGWNPISITKMLLTNTVSGETVISPRQEILFTCSGGEDHYKTSFAVFGFRYAQVIAEGFTVKPEDFTAIAVYSDMEPTGDFTCSHEGVNQLVENIRWSMKGNYLDLPTDCPTRERLGWTGDAQIFFDTGSYFMDVSAFFDKWIRDMQDAQYDNGLLPAVMPYSGVDMMYKNSGGSVGWCDALVLIPWRHYQRYGNLALLERCWPMMKRYADYIIDHLGMTDKKAAKGNPYADFAYEKGFHFGEWLEPEEFQETISAASMPKHLEEATAYWFYVASTLQEIARLLGDTAQEKKLSPYIMGAKNAYDLLFVRSGKLDTDRQAKLVRPLALGLLEGAAKKKAQQRLKEAVEHYDYRVGTGFLSTVFLLPVLSEAGETETAYKVLENTQMPGWLFEVENGATTIWENWSGTTTGENNTGSLNHYSPGAVAQWLFETCAGIRPDGERHFLLSPTPGGSLTHAGARWLSPCGEVRCAWEIKDGKTTYRGSVPANCSAQLRLPDGTVLQLEAGEFEVTQ